MPADDGPGSRDGEVAHDALAERELLERVSAVAGRSGRPGRGVEGSRRGR